MKPLGTWSRLTGFAEIIITCSPMADASVANTVKIPQLHGLMEDPADSVWLASTSILLEPREVHRQVTPCLLWRGNTPVVSIASTPLPPRSRSQPEIRRTFLVFILAVCTINHTTPPPHQTNVVSRLFVHYPATHWPAAHLDIRQDQPVSNLNWTFW